MYNRRRTAMGLVMLGAGVFSLAAGGANAHTASSGPDFHGEAHAAYLRVDGTLGDTEIIDLDLFPAAAEVDTTGATSDDGLAHARSANLDATLLGAIDLSGILSEAHVDSTTASPRPAPVERTLLPVVAPPVANVAVSNAEAATWWNGLDDCLPTREFALATTDVARAEVLSASPLGYPAATVDNEVGGAVATRSFVDQSPANPFALRATAQAQTLSLDLFAGTDLETSIDTVGTFTMWAEADGTTGDTFVDWPVVTIVLPGGTTVGPVRVDELDPVVIPIAGELDAALGAATLGSITIDTGAVSLDRATAAESDISGALLLVDVELSVGGAPRIDASIHVAPLEASVHVPEPLRCGQHVTTTTTSTPSPTAPSTVPPPPTTPPVTTEIARGSLAATGSGSVTLFALALILVVGGAACLFTSSELEAAAIRSR